MKLPSGNPAPRPRLPAASNDTAAVFDEAGEHFGLSEQDGVFVQLVDGLGEAMGPVGRGHRAGGVEAGGHGEEVGDLENGQLDELIRHIAAGWPRIAHKRSVDNRRRGKRTNFLPGHDSSGILPS